MPIIIDLVSSDEETSPTKSAINTLAAFRPHKQKANTSNARQAAQNGAQRQRPAGPKENGPPQAAPRALVPNPVAQHVPQLHQTDNGPRRAEMSAPAQYIREHETTPLATHSATRSSTATPDTPSLADLLQRDAEESARRNGWRGHRSPSPPPPPPLPMQTSPVRKSKMARRSGPVAGQARVDKAQDFYAKQKMKSNTQAISKQQRQSGTIDTAHESVANSLKSQNAPATSGLPEMEPQPTVGALSAKRKSLPAAQGLQSALKRKREASLQNRGEATGQNGTNGRLNTNDSVPSTALNAGPRARRSRDFEESSDDDSDDVPDMIPARPAQKIGSAAPKSTSAAPKSAMSVDSPFESLSTNEIGAWKMPSSNESEAWHSASESARGNPPFPVDLPHNSKIVRLPIKATASRPTPLPQAAGLIDTGVTLPPATSISASNFAPTPHPAPLAAEDAEFHAKEHPSNVRLRYTAEEDAKLIYLRQVENKIPWDEMPRHFQGRTQGSLKLRYNGLKGKTATASSLPNASAANVSAVSPSSPPAALAATEVAGSYATGHSSNHKSRYELAEDHDLVYLKEVENISWDEMPQHFRGRTREALKFRYYTLKNHKSATTPSLRDTLSATAIMASPPTSGLPFPPPAAPAVAEALELDETEQRSNHNSRYTAEEDNDLVRLKEVDKGSWDEIAQHFQHRTREALQFRYHTLKKRRSAATSSLHSTNFATASATSSLASGTELSSVTAPPPPPRAPAVAPAVAASGVTGQSSNFGSRYTAEEDARLIDLRRTQNISWDDMPQYFEGRTQGSLQVRYSGLCRGTTTTTRTHRGRDNTNLLPEGTEYCAPARRKHKITRTEGFVTWAEVKANNLGIDDEDPMDVDVLPQLSKEEIQQPAKGLAARDVAHSSSLARLLRAREVGSNGGRQRPRLTKVPDELKTHISDSLGPRRFFNGTSRDVTCVAWAPDGNRFAAGSIAISDATSMQYNGPYNLLLGDVQMNRLLELPEHHVPRPIITDTKNVNSSHGMQETQDARLFMTVAAVEFSRDGRRLFTAGGDGVARMYKASNGECLDAFNHGASVDLLSWRDDGILATACHRSDDEAVRVLQCNTKQRKFSATTTTAPAKYASTPVFPTALKWGAAPSQRNYLLAGFSGDTYDEGTAAGEIRLWDVQHNTLISLAGSSRNVFDVAWNPSPSSGSTIFAVASAKAERRAGVRSAIQCYGNTGTGTRSVIEWDSPALDINDVLYCPHDDNLIAAGATDGRVYLWDKRFASRNQAPLHVLRHGETKNVLDPDRDLEVADTGVRFLSWSATANRLYSGSSDGVVKVWNPYRTTADALVKNVATFKSAIMSGAFSPDYCGLLIGEDQGQLNLLGIDRENRSVHAAKRFDLHTAQSKEQPSEDKFAAARELLGSGQIELRPMGALPVRQAVQGPNYVGPFMEPSSEYIDELSDEYHAAEAEVRDSQRQRQIDLDTTRKQDSGTSKDKDVRDAEARLSRVRDAWTLAEKKRLDFRELNPEALRLQHDFKSQEADATGTSLERAMRRCRLECNYLPAAGDDDGEAPDNHASEQRVPGILRTRRETVDLSDITNAEVAEAGLTSKCSSCTGPSPAPQKDKLPLCSKCTITRSGRTARCAQCGIPVRPKADSSQERNLCQRCNFSCLRCGSVEDLTLDADTVRCTPCGLAWEVGVLGYGLKTKLGKKGENLKRVPREDGEDGEKLGEEEIERLASRWRVPLVDGTD